MGHLLVMGRKSEYRLNCIGIRKMDLVLSEMKPVPVID
jgi:hypothetical protein